MRNIHLAVCVSASALLSPITMSRVDAAVICQQKKNLVLRATACRRKEVTLGEVVTKDQLPMIPPDPDDVKYVAYHIATSQNVPGSMDTRINFDAADVDPAVT
jgi:hypothetical protein